MSLCVDSTTLTFDGVRADDGGEPEEVTLTITKYCLDPSPSFEGFLAAHDQRLDTTFLFSPPTDGEYRVVYTGNVSGIIETDDVIVKTHANNEIGKVSKDDVNKILCSDCPTSEYMYKKALVSMADEFAKCDRFCEAEQFLLDVIEDDCESKIRNCGCC